MEKKELERTAALIDQRFGLEFEQEPLSEAALLEVLTRKIEDMMAYRLDVLMGLLYRMDVLEVDLKRVLHPNFPEPPARALAKLVLDRQKAKMEIRNRFEVTDEGIGDEWKW